MNLERQQAIDYLRAPTGGLWRWSENGAVLVWRDGTTIAFREEIVQILQWLAPGGLPPFGAIVLLLAACKNKLPALSDIVTRSDVPLPAQMRSDAALLTKAREQLALRLEVALVQFKKLAQFPPEIISGSKAKCALAEAVFETAKKPDHKEARVILAGLREPLSDADLLNAESGDFCQATIPLIHLVAHGLSHHSIASLTLRLKTGLESLPVATEENLPAADRACHLINELSRDRELGLVARAARELMAVVRLPRRLGERDEMAIGGVSDITNRGSLDRLLISEMAHDDLTLAVRVALNEALYLRREPPAHEPPGALALLLDSGVRLWGVPRVLATAVALALVARDKQHSQLFTWRAHGKKLLPVDLLSSEGLTSHLGALETPAHPGEAVAAFAEAIAASAESQSVLITHHDTLADPEFRRALAEASGGPGFIAAVDNAGRFELHALPLARRAPVCAADLDLPSLFNEAPNVPLIKTNADPDLPAIFGVSPFPFLLPLAGRVNDWIKADDAYCYAVMNERRLLQFRDNQSGGRILTTELPPGKPVWLDNINGTVHIIKNCTSQRPARLLSFPLPEGPLRTVDLMNGEEALAAYCYGEVILVIRSHDVRAYALGDGRLLGTIRNPYQWLHGRYFRTDKSFLFAVWDGAQVKFEPVSLPGSFSASVILQVFDRTGMQGPWIIHKQGFVISTASDEQIKLPMPSGKVYGLEKAQVSKDGHRIFVSMTYPKWSALKYLVTGEVRNLTVNRTPDPMLNPQPALPTWNLYRLIESVAVLEDGLALRGRKQRWRKIGLDHVGALTMSLLPASDAPRQSIDFAPPKPTPHGCSLQLAEWPGGSRAWLDDRGLLHLKSHDLSVPEISLVLCEGEMAGWTARGHLSGPAFFHEGFHHLEPLPVFESLMRFVKCL